MDQGLQRLILEEYCTSSTKSLAGKGLHLLGSSSHGKLVAYFSVVISAMARRGLARPLQWREIGQRTPASPGRMTPCRA